MASKTTDSKTDTKAHNTSSTNEKFNHRRLSMFHHDKCNSGHRKIGHGRQRSSSAHRNLEVYHHSLPELDLESMIPSFNLYYWQCLRGLVRPLGTAEEEEASSDFEPVENGEVEVEDEGDEDDDDFDSDDSQQGAVPSKRKRSDKDDSDSDDDGGEDDVRPSKR